MTFPIKTYDPANQFQFVCPVFKATTKIASCLTLRDLVWRGEHPEQRKGCQCAMESGKCPIPVIVTKITRLRNDPYHSDAPKVGALEFDILDAIAPVLTSDRAMQRHGVSAGEEKLLIKANEDARNGVRIITKPPRRIERVVDMEDVKAPAAALPAPTDASELVRAAQSGDMAAAINAEVGS